MPLYNEQGYVDISYILSHKMPFVFVVGGRGTGKTYGGLKHVYTQEIKFMYMRRTQTQHDLVSRPEMSPFKAINRDIGSEIISEPITKYNAGFYNDNAQEKEIIGYSCALSTISNMRGFDASDVKLLLYDEFIPERHERPIKNEGIAFLNAYETINRNREINGEAPLTALCLANSNELANPLFMALNIVTHCENMKKKKQEMSILHDRGIAIFMLDNSPISIAKKETALYKATQGSDFEDMALGNRFKGSDYEDIKPQDMREYKSVVGIGNITVYKHKSKPHYYISTHRRGTPVIFEDNDAGKRKFLQQCRGLWWHYIAGSIYYENYLCYTVLKNYFKAS